MPSRRPSKSSSRVLTDHEEIRRWVEERGGTPTRVKSTGDEEDPGIIRIDFPGYSGEGTLEPISWDEFFEKFDERGLALLVQDQTASGERSNFNKFVSRETVEPKQRETKSAGRGRSRGRAAVHQPASQPQQRAEAPPDQARARVRPGRAEAPPDQARARVRPGRAEAPPDRPKAAQGRGKPPVLAPEPRKNPLLGAQPAVRQRGPRYLVHRGKLAKQIAVSGRSH